MAAIEGRAVKLVIKIDNESLKLPTSVTWYHNGMPIEEDYAHEFEADGSLMFPSVELGHLGIYKAMVANEHGSVQQEVRLVVKEELETSIKDAAADAVSNSEIVYTRPIPVSNFAKYVAELHGDVNQHFKELFQVNALLFACVCGCCHEIMDKRRHIKTFYYTNIPCSENCIMASISS